MTCPSCGAGLETPLACGACGVLIETTYCIDPFAVLGLEPSVDVDDADLRKRLRRFTRLVHPNFFALEAADQQLLSERNNAILNRAYDVVGDAPSRASSLVESLNGPSEKDLGAMPQAFLMEVMEWNETLDESEPGSPALAALEAELHTHRDSLVTQISTSLTPLPEAGAKSLADTRKLLNALRYIDRALARVTGHPSPL